MLFKKAYRAIWRHKKAYLACVFLTLVGTMMLTAYGTAVAGLVNAKGYFYTNYRLAHVWARVSAIPTSEVDRLRNIPGVFDVTHRTVLEVRAEAYGPQPTGGPQPAEGPLPVKNSDDIIILRLLSFVPGDENRINDFKLNGIEPSSQNDIALNLMHKETRGLQIGDSIRLFTQGRAFNFSVTGSFMSPEYAYIARGGAEMLPAHNVFGIGYITEDAMSSLTGRPGIANEVLFTLMDGYEFEDVQAAISDALAPYGLISILDRNAQISYAMLDMQVAGIEAVANSLPLVFIAMAAVVLYLMLKRIIEQERTQIGTLKAFGYSNRDMLLHYMTYGGITGFIGGILGFAYGAAIAPLYLSIFLEFYTMPELAQAVDPMYGLASVGIGISGGLLGALMGALKALKLTPAEAMRPESPKPIKYDVVGKIKWLKYILTSRGQMALRSVLRNPMRSGFIVLGVTFSYMLLAVFGDMEGMVDTLLYQQFEDIRIYDVRVTLNQPADYNQVVEAAFGVRHTTNAEGIWELPVTLANRHLREGTVITGIPADGNLFRIFDSRTNTAYPPPTDGLIITNGLADQINARAGDMVYISTFLAEEDIPVPVTRVVEQNVGSGAFMELSALSGLVGHPPVASAIILTTNNMEYTTDRFTESPIVGTVESKDATLQAYIEMMAPFTFIYSVMFFMGVAVAFAIIYNTSTISLSERQREFATLRVLGLTVNEVCEIMRFEYWTLAVIGIAIGIPAAGGLMAAINTMLDTGIMSMPSTLSTGAHISAAAGTALAIILSNMLAKRKIRTFDMVEVLKERE